MRTLCFAVDLKNDPLLIERYKSMHAPGGPPSAVTRAIRADGIRDMHIYLSGNRLFMIMQVADGFSLSAKSAGDAANPEVAAWEEQMWAFQQALPWARPGEKWVPAELIFDLAEHQGHSPTV